MNILGDFWNFTATNLRTKVAQIFTDVKAILTKSKFNTYTMLGLLFGYFWKIGLLFIQTSGQTERLLVVVTSSSFDFIFFYVEKRVLTSMIRCIDYLFNIWPFKSINFRPIACKFAKSGWTFCQIFCKPSKNYQRLQFLAKNSPNLVTLVLRTLKHVKI